MPSEFARAVPRVYRTSGKADVQGFLVDAVRSCGGRILFESPHTRAPLFVAFELESGERIGLLAYLFRANDLTIRNRPADERRFHLRYGAEASWHAVEHRVAFDVAGIDVTAVLAVDLEADVFVALDPSSYDPLPMGISIEYKDAHVEAAQRDGWHVWERDTIRGAVRRARAPNGLDTMIAFRPEHLLTLVRLEREARSLGLDPALRFRAAQVARQRRAGSVSVRHALEDDFELTGEQILDIITSRSRLATAVRGGVAEHHLERQLGRDPLVTGVTAVDRDGGDFEVALAGGRKLLVECKNASPNRYASGDLRVEIQKTRASKHDPASRYYRVDQFDVVAACVFSATGQWRFRYQWTSTLARHGEYPGRVAPLQRIDEGWPPSLSELMRD